MDNVNQEQNMNMQFKVETMAYSISAPLEFFPCKN